MGISHPMVGLAVCPVFKTSILQEIVSIRGLSGSHGRSGLLWFCRLFGLSRLRRLCWGLSSLASSHGEILDFPSRTTCGIGVVAESDAHLLAHPRCRNVEIGFGESLPIATFRPFLVENSPTFSSLLSIVFVGDQKLLVFIALVVAEHIFKSYVSFLHIGEVNLRAYEVVSASGGLLALVVVARSLSCFEVNLPFSSTSGGDSGE